MRLAPLLLIPCALGAQSPRSLPWRLAASSPWRAAEPAAPPAPCPPAAPQETPLKVMVRPDGTLRVVDAKGGLRARLGLPGRPLRLYRDGGLPVEAWQAPLSFPAATPLSGGLAALPWDAEDFRGALQGLLWILDDGEATLTVLHPATGRWVHVALPGGAFPRLRFHPTCLELLCGGEPEGRPAAWQAPWAALLPQLLQLSTPADAAPKGTALQPFPRE